MNTLRTRHSFGLAAVALVQQRADSLSSRQGTHDCQAVAIVGNALESLAPVTTARRVFGRLAGYEADISSTVRDLGATVVAHTLLMIDSYFLGKLGPSGSWWFIRTFADLEVHLNITTDDSFPADVLAVLFDENIPNQLVIMASAKLAPDTAASLVTQRVLGLLGSRSRSLTATPEPHKPDPLLEPVDHAPWCDPELHFDGRHTDRSDPDTQVCSAAVEMAFGEPNLKAGFDIESVKVELEHLRSFPDRDGSPAETVLYLSVDGGQVASLDRHHTEGLACALLAQLARMHGELLLGDHLVALATRMQDPSRTTGCLEALRALLADNTPQQMAAAT